VESFLKSFAMHFLNSFVFPWIQINLFKMESSALEIRPLSLLPAPFRPQNPQDWEPYKEAVARLYSGMELSAVIKAMEEQYNFRAT
jgi:hypothetical protein